MAALTGCTLKASNGEMGRDEMNLFVSGVRGNGDGWGEEERSEWDQTVSNLGFLRKKNVKTQLLGGKKYK